MKITRFNDEWAAQQTTGTSGTSGGSGAVGGITVNPTPLTDGYVLTYDAASGTFILAAGGGGGGATSPLTGATDGGTGDLGASVGFADGDGTSGGFGFVNGGDGGAGKPGGDAFIGSGQYDSGTEPGALVYLTGGSVGLPGQITVQANNSQGTAGQFLGSDGASQTVWTTPTIRHAASVPTGAPGVGELPIALDTTTSPAHGYAWTGAAWTRFS